MTTLRAVIYSRISHDPQDKQLGVERQEQDCVRLLSRRGWELAFPPFHENDTSASTRSSTKRPVQMLAQLQAGMADVLVCYSTSRLTRRPLDYERLIRLTQDRGVRIATVVSGAVDLSTADGRVIARVLAAMDAAEAERGSVSGSAAPACSGPRSASGTVALSLPSAIAWWTLAASGRWWSCRRRRR